MITHHSGLELLKRREASIRDGCRILLFLVSTVHDEQLFKLYKRLAREIDDAVGPACIALAFMSVPEGPAWTELQDRPQLTF